MRDRIVPVYAVEEHYTWLTCPPGILGHSIEYFTRLKLSCFLPRPGIYQGIFLVLFHCLHELLGYSHREVEVLKRSLLFFGGDEFQNIWVVNIQNGHVGPSPHAPLFYDISSSIKYLNKGYGSGGHTSRGTYQVPLRPYMRKRKPCSAPTLVDQGGVLYFLEDGFHGILHR